MSMPFIEEEFTFTQPDGSTLQVRGTGDQHQARFETLDGFTIIEDPVSGFYHYARPADVGEGLLAAGIRAGALDPALLGLERGLRAGRAEGREVAEAMPGLPRTPSRWEMRRAERRETMRFSEAAPGILPAPPQRQTVGRFVGLTLLIDFADEPATISRQEVEDFCNQQSYSGFGNSGSVRDYFYDISDQKLEYTNIVVPYYRARHPRSYYTNEQIAQPKRARELIKEALDALRAGGFDASGLTSDDRDYVYALNVFYAGTRVNNWAKGLWPHAFHLGSPYALGPGKKIYDYQITDMTQELTLGTFCHENGHMICDFPDLYDYGYESNGAGKFCLMCAGGSGAGAKNPAQVGAYLKHAAGWTSQSTLVQPGQTVTLAAGRNEFAFHRKSGVEYFVIENRNATGRDSALGASGLAVWHVDELGSNDNEAGSPTLHYECALVQADGLKELESGSDQGDDKDLFRAGHVTTLSDSTVPDCKWWDRSPSGLHLDAIGAAGSTMTFSVV